MKRLHLYLSPRLFWALAFVLLLAVGSARAQDVPSVPSAPTVEATAIPADPAEQTEDIKDAAQSNLLAMLALFGAVAVIGILAFAGVVIRHVSGLVPAEFAAPVYTSGNVLYSKRQDFLEQKRAEAATNSIFWDDAFWDTAVKVSADEWQKFIDEAAAKGVVLPTRPGMFGSRSPTPLG